MQVLPTVFATIHVQTAQTDCVHSPKSQSVINVAILGFVKEVILQPILLKSNGEMQPNYDKCISENIDESKSGVDIDSRREILRKADIATINYMCNYT